ncbi:transcription factor RelB isoform X2 [Microcaecilia unicolor]|uniref:Transcription factor RelB isoform X2 n=1 Tax=Microcaecilia unicolor TaxID=1415580 RepID=A0A6P7ZD89_9AMPH|nr:transcription factor RelB isoform X2 [Microcaecilia unicolor]
MRDPRSGRGEPGSQCSPRVSALSIVASVPSMTSGMMCPICPSELSLELIDEYIKEKEAEDPPNQVIAENLKLVPRSTDPELLSQCRALEISPVNDTKPLEIPLSLCSHADLGPSERMQSVTVGVHMALPCDRRSEPWCIKPAPHSVASCSFSSLSSNVLPVNDALEALLLPKPELKIIEQPKQRGMRFRYVCEGRSAGSILGENSTDQSKIMPAIEVLNCDNLKEVKVMASLVWKDSPYRVHPHSLVGKDCHDGICEVTIKPKLKRTHSFHNLGIQCVRKKEIEEAVEKKLKLGIDPFNGHWKNHEEVDMNVVRLCFQACYQDSSGNTETLGPILSEPIYDKKSTNTSELKICRMNKETGQCGGGEEVYLLCDKVQKEDVAVVFRRDCWEARADFSQADVHRQIAIVFKTPPYQDLEIGEPVTVNVYLQRLTDSVCSEPCAFTYLPKDHDTYGVDQKRKRGLPDVMGELSGPDPHGIEAKRRMKKPTYKDHLFSDLTTGTVLPAFSQLCSMEQPSTSEFSSGTRNARFQAEDSFSDYDYFSKSQSLASYMGAQTSEVKFSDLNGAQEEDLQQKIFLDPLYRYVESIPENLLSSNNTNSSNIAHLVGSSLRASEYQEDVASFLPQLPHEGNMKQT